MNKPFPKPSFCTFAPAFTITGTQPSILVGTDSGGIYKFNDFHSKFYVYGKPIHESDKLNSFVSRESFKQGHLYEVKFVMFVNGNPERFVSLDDNGTLCVWKYTKNAFNRDLGFFRPYDLKRFEICFNF